MTSLPIPMGPIRPAMPDELATVRAIDDDACTLYVDFGVGLDIPDDHPFYDRERACWAAALAAGEVFFACAEDGAPVGVAVLVERDGKRHLEQLSVRRAWMRRGVGASLVRFALGRAGGALTLTTWAHMPFNRPFYERLGFRTLDARDVGPELAETLRDERACLPAPEHRIAMHHSVSR